ncbi:hypothetical protein ACTFIZ_006711 [Dictyostelium cf. discoideum]
MSTISKKWNNFISLTISNHIINNKLFEHWLEIDYKCEPPSFAHYLKSNLYLDDSSTIDDFKEIKMKFENNQLVYNRIVVNHDTYYGHHGNDKILLKISEYISNENSEIISNLFKILELNYVLWFGGGYIPKSKKEDDDDHDKGNKECNEIYFNNLLISGFNGDVREDEETLKIFKIFKGKNLIYEVLDFSNENPTHINYSVLFNPDNSGQQVESIQVKNKSEFYEEFVESRHLIKVNQFKNLHSITIPIDTFQILSNLSEETGFNTFFGNIVESSNSKNMKSELNQMINSFITSKSLKNLNIYYPISYEDFLGFDESEIEINKKFESYSFKPLFSELNTSIERIGCGGGGGGGSSSGSGGSGSGSGRNELHEEQTISTHQYLFENIFSSKLTSIRHYKINFKDSKQLKLIFNIK